MALGVLAYPKISSKDFRLIQKFRREYDELYYSLVTPHFSFVFPLESVEKKPFIAEVIDKVKGIESIKFEIKCTCVNKDAIIEYYHLLLVPDEGYSSVVKLHDRLYSGLFFVELRLDIDFIPHVGIANSKDKYQVKKWADDWNSSEFCIEGTIDELTIIEYANNQLQDIEHVKLQ